MTTEHDKEKEILLQALRNVQKAFTQLGEELVYFGHSIVEEFSKHLK
jgi:hypothetical protein